MTDILLYVVLGLQVIGLILILIVWRRQNSGNISALKTTCEGLEKGQERLETLVREEMAGNRRETGEQARAARDEAGVAALKLVEQFGALQRDNVAFREHISERLSTNLSAFGKNLVGQLELSGASHKGEAAQMRAELLAAFGHLDAALGAQLKAATAGQDENFAGLERRFLGIGERNAEQLHSMDDAIVERLELLGTQARDNWDAKRAQDLAANTQARRELHDALERLSQAVAHNFANAGEAQRGQFDSFAARVAALADTADNRAQQLRDTVDGRLQLLQDDNAKKLEEMRHTVDEKLQGTLNERLGESFRLVSERLELVHAGLGEMRTLANGVGDLKKILTNVKTRGNWGEIQLGNLLEQMLTADQYGTNVATIPGSSERVEFAIRLPGQEHIQKVVWLPIDAKFPQENYTRLLEAHENCDKNEIEMLGKQLEAQIKRSAQEICSKYVCAPHTTDFAILFLPTEGLYAEVIRRSGLIDVLQRECRVTVAGPTTLAAILNALQMGFRTLAIQQRSSEVWNTLGKVKSEFGKYGDVLDAVQKKLTEASNKIEETRKRSRAIERQLRDVEVPAQDAMPSLPRLVTDNDEENAREDAA